MEPNKKLEQGCLSFLARTVAVRLISVGVVLILVIFSCLFGSVIGSFKDGTWGLIAGVLAFAGLVFGGGFAFAFITVYRRKLYLDQAFVPLGLTGGIYRLVFRHYAGEIRGRKVEVFFSRGPKVEILIQTKLKTRLGVSPACGDTMFFSKLVDSQPLEHNIESLKNLRFWAEEATWARDLIAGRGVQERILRLLTSQTFFVRSFAKLYPGIFELHFSGNTNVFSWEIPPGQVQRWFADAFDILEFAETRLTPPQKPIEMSSAESLALSIKRKDTTKISIILAISMLVFFFFIFIFAFLFVYLIK